LYVLEQMLRRRQINTDPGGRIVRFGLGIADAVRWPVERLFERLAWPFERIAWTVERRLVWPLRERSAGLGPSGRLAGAGAIAAAAAAAVLVGVLLSEGNGAESAERTGARVGLVPGHAKATDVEAPTGPALQGVPPSFGVSKGPGVATESGDESSGAESGGAGETGASGETGGAEAAEASAEASPTEADGAATASSAKPVPAGPRAMKVARRFSEAFVFYEIGQRQVRAKAVFGETATPQLARALAERPPRLPQGTEVPKARVVNLVPGPRRGKAYTVSASLLRVGLTSELRLEIEKQDGSWLVTDVRG
jgi:hypothetical protein